MTTQQYIGARYVPIFGRKDEESIEWNNSKTYEPLTIVLHEGNSYTSRQFVPAGIDIKNEDFWALTGNYNAQVEQYRQDTQNAHTLAQTALTLAQTNETNLLLKADAATTYSKTDVDTKLSTKADSATTYSKTETDARIATLRPGSNILDYGVKNDGTDVTDALNSILSTGNNNLFFPDGVYAISNTLNVPQGSRITLSAGAIIRAINDMGTMISLSRVIDSTVTTVIGGNGQIDGNGRASNGIVGLGTTININGIQISNCKGIALDLSHAHAAIVNNVVIMGNGSETVAPTTVGIKTNFDSQFSNVRMWCVWKMFETRGMNLFTNIYGWAGGAYDGSVGFDNYDNNEIDIRGENIYVDCFLTAIHSTSFAHVSIDNFIPMFNNPTGTPATIYDVPVDSAIDIRGGMECYSSNPFTLLKRPLQRINNLGFIDDIYTLKSNLTDFENYCSTRNSSLINKFIQLSYADITIPPNKCIKLYKQQTAISKAAFYNTYGDLREEIVVAEWGVASHSGNTPSSTVVFMKKKVDDGLELYLANTGTTDFMLSPTYIKLENVGYSGKGYGVKFDANSLQPIDSNTMTNI